MSDVTRILDALDQGDPHAAEELLPLVYNELRRLAAQKLSHEKPGQTLQATALVHEAYLRLLGPGDGRWENRRHFFAAAAEAMRRILIEIARHKQSTKRGGDCIRVTLNETDLAIVGRSDDLIALDEALDNLAEEDAFVAELVKLHYFTGLSIDEVAKVMSISPRTAYRHWAYAKSWLALELGERRHS